MLFGKKEDEVSVLIEEHAATIEECLNVLVKGMYAYLDGEYCTCDTTREDIVVQEHLADIKRREIQLKLYEGAFMPLYRDDIYLFTDMFDTIADQTKAIANILVLERPSIPQDMAQDMKTILDHSVAPYTNLKDAILHFGEDRKVILEQSREIERYEHEVDQIEYQIRKKIFESPLSLAEKIQLRDFVLAIASISDKIEDCSDLLEVMAVKRHI
jgi:predicted phosphate transport protein (TIGR00153 family)